MQLPTFGEIFISNDDVQGGLENLKLFKGKLITSLCGGCRKIFVIEEGQDNQGLISTLHTPENDDCDRTFTDDQEALHSFDNKGSIREIVTGKRHTVFLTEVGDVYSYGYGEYGTLGHGGVYSLNIPKKILRLSSVQQISCGEYHTLALIKGGDLFSWGRGFEGQLGIRKDIDTAASPMFLTTFYKNPIVTTACGPYHSLAVDVQGRLYGWGEARFGQLGTGRKVKELLPTQIVFEIEQPSIQSQLRASILNAQSENIKVISVSGGYGHSAAITEGGDLYTWGFNQRGQLGLGEGKSTWYPKRVKADMLGNQVPKFKKVGCGYYTTFAIDELGALWSWGGGNIGHQNEKLVDQPRKLVIEDRKFTNILANGQVAAFFSSMRIISMRPNLGPSSGGTIISLIGTGFCNTSRQSARFRLGNSVVEVGCEYDPQTETFRCCTPNFEETEEQYPNECVVELTLDGKVYIECEQKFLVYSSKIVSQSIYPKCASIHGGTTLLLTINIDEITQRYMKHLNVGFQPRTKKKDEVIQSKNVANNKPLNPLDLSLNDPELERENWVCVEGFYDKGKISCTIPQVSQLQSDSLNFNVDVSINGQQFTGNPIVFRFYDITIKEIKPNLVMSEGGSAVQVLGDGFFDTTNKKVKFKTQFGERLIEIVWDKQDRFYQLVAPPLSWLLGGQQPTPELLDQARAGGVETFLTLSGIEWITMGPFYYIDPELQRIAPWNIDDKLPEEEKRNRFLAEEPYVDVLEGLSEQDRVKKQDELNKQIDADELELNYYFKKQGHYLYLYGSNIINTGKLVVQFVYNGNQAINTNGVFKNKCKIGAQIPELEGLPTGIHDVIVEISLNGQQFSHSNKQFKYMAFDKTLTDQQKTKLEDEEVKKLKKTQPKKK